MVGSLFAMPTTCGFPNCKFRSRYRGHHDNRHFYRIPKKPTTLRERWLQAIGRTETTIVNQQLRICSGHFHGGRKSEGDIPVADPDVDSPIRIELSSIAVGKRCEKLPRCRRTTALSLSHQASRRMPGKSDSRSCISSGSSNGSRAGSDTGSVKNDVKLVSMVSSVPRRPLVALLDGRDCAVEMPLLADVAQVAFCDAETTNGIHERVLNEALAVMVHGSMPLTRNDLEKFKSLKVIVKLGTGSDSINVKAASELGIAVSNITGFCTEEVADSTLCMILNLYRQTYWLACDVLSGKKISSPEALSDAASGSVRIRGETLGIIGFGCVGQAVALRAKAFKFNTIFYDPFIRDGIDKSLGVTRVHTLEELLHQSGCVTLHCTPNEHNRHIINDISIQQMRRGAYIVNTAHESLIDESALCAALKSGRVRGAAIDCRENKHLSFEESPFNDCSNVICTPQSAYFSDQSMHELREMAAREMRSSLIGPIPHSLRYCINRDICIKTDCSSRNRLKSRPTVSTVVHTLRLHNNVAVNLPQVAAAVRVEDQLRLHQPVSNLFDEHREVLDCSSKLSEFTPTSRPPSTSTDMDKSEMLV